MKRLASGWGRYPCLETEWLAASTPAQARAATAAHEGLIARGNGRSYGDAALGAAVTLATGGLDRMISFDEARGVLRAQAGVLLGDIISAFLPRGWFPFVVPGTRYVTLGGAIAADVHGKNHHSEGGFGDYVEALLLAMPDGSVKTASRDENPDLFRHTLGGMGLTGTLLEASIRLRRVETGWIRQQTIVAENLDAAMRTLAKAESSTYSVAWIDCLARGAQLGRSLVYLGEHASRAELAGRTPFPPLRPAKLTVPLDLPALALSHLSVAAFNELYFRMGARKAGPSFLVPAGPYFFPLDGVNQWNRIYGKRGFVQHQSVLPPDAAPAALAEMLGIITTRGNASFLAVLKKLGAAQAGASHGTLSFPMAGYTLALDFPLSPGLEAFLSELDAVVVRAGGRIYLAKDARQSRETFDAGYPAADSFRAWRRDNDLSRLSSSLSQRLGL